jgi:hypothetical protein
MRSQIKTECKLLILAELIEENNDATLEELRYLLYQKIGFTMHSNDGKNGKTLKHDFKKKLSFRARKALTEFRVCDMSSGKKSEKFVSKT